LITNKHPDRKRILIVLQRALHVRNFVASGVVDALTDQAIVLLVLPAKLAKGINGDLLAKVEIKSLEDFQPSGYIKKRFLIFSRRMSLFQRKKSNSTYKEKVKIRFFVFRTRNTRMIRAILRQLPMNLLAFLISLTTDSESLAKQILNKFKINRNALKLINNFNPDVVFSSTVIHETNDVEIVKAAKLKNIKLVNFVASWDNLTSKGFFIVRPDKLLVWGQADKESAINEHGFDSEQITITGAPHFDGYFDKNVATDRKRFLTDRELDPQKKILLFAGTTFSLIANEPSMVKSLSNYLSQTGYDDVLIWYRPHPGAMRLKAIKELNGIHNIYIDDQIINRQDDPIIKSGFSVHKETLYHFKNLINCSECVLSIFSTMAVEFALWGKPSVWINFHYDNKGNEFNSIGRNILSYSHIQPVLKWPGVYLAESFSSMTKYIELILAGEQAHNSNLLQKNAETIAFNLDAKAQSRIIDALLEK